MIVVVALVVVVETIISDEKKLVSCSPNWSGYGIFGKT